MPKSPSQESEASGDGLTARQRSIAEGLSSPSLASLRSRSRGAGIDFGFATDETLLMALSEGIEEAFDALFSRHSKAVFSFLSRLVVGRVDPEDLLQETFLRILTHAGEFRSGADFKPWLFTIARNIAYNAMKKGRSRSELEVQADLSDWDPDHGRGSAVENPGTNLERKERREAVLAALEELPPMHREIIVLTMFHNFSYEQAAAITGDPEGTLRSRMFHGLRKLREKLKEGI